jgi:hypothetical protein
MPPRNKPARRSSARQLSRKSAVTPREFEYLLKRAEKYLSQRGKQLVRTAQSARKARVTAA